MRAQIQSEEDKRIFDALDALAATCRTEGHAAFGKPIRECLEPLCVAEYVHES